MSTWIWMFAAAPCKSSNMVDLRGPSIGSPTIWESTHGTDMHRSTLNSSNTWVKSSSTIATSLSSVPASMFRVLPRYMASALRVFRCGDWYNCYLNIQTNQMVELFRNLQKVGAQHISDVLLTGVARNHVLL